MPVVERVLDAVQPFDHEFIDRERQPVFLHSLGADENAEIEQRADFLVIVTGIYGAVDLHEALAMGDNIRGFHAVDPQGIGPLAFGVRRRHLVDIVPVAFQTFEHRIPSPDLRRVALQLALRLVPGAHEDRLLALQRRDPAFELGFLQQVGISRHHGHPLREVHPRILADGPLVQPPRT